jgi:hypothetical protein
MEDDLGHSRMSKQLPDAYRKALKAVRARQVGLDFGD